MTPNLEKATSKYSEGIGSVCTSFTSKSIFFRESSLAEFLALSSIGSEISNPNTFPSGTFLAISKEVSPHPQPISKIVSLSEKSILLIAFFPSGLSIMSISLCLSTQTSPPAPDQNSLCFLFISSISTISVLYHFIQIDVRIVNKVLIYGH